jgi:hypothetical protein
MALSSFHPTEPLNNWRAGHRLATEQGAVDVVGFCALGTNVGPACDRDADCAAGEVCSIVAALDGAGDAICRAPLAGDQPAGAPCAGPVAPCTSSVCLNGACADLCLDDGDCEGGFVCDRRPLFGGREAGACIPP